MQTKEDHPTGIPDSLIGPGIQTTDTFDSVYQRYPDTCAIRAQEIILRDYGINVTQDDLIRLSSDQGWYNDGHGTTLDNVGKILNHYGVETACHQEGNIGNLLEELSQGHRVIVGADSDELRGETGFLHGIGEFFGFKNPDHTLLVSAMDDSDPDNRKIIITDPGTGEVAHFYTLEEFENAWEDSKCFYVTTNKPPGGLPRL